MRVIILVLCILIPNLSLAAAFTSSGSGNWNAAATWGGAGVPGVGDSATIQAGHKVTVDGTRSVGTSPGNTTTYDLDISGMLYFSDTVDPVLNVYSSIRVNSGGSIQIGTSSASPYSCAHEAHLYMRTSAAGQKYAIYLNQGKLNLYGCATYHGTGATTVRARIASCTPACTVGAGRTITFDRDVNWNAAPGGLADSILIGVGGSLSAPAPGDDPEEITSWGAPAANQINGVTFTENHKAGDIVYNATRNIIFQSDSATVHPRIYTSDNFNDPYYMRYVHIDEFSDSYTTDYAAVNQGSQGYTLGTIDYTAVTNAEDGSSTGCFTFATGGWDSFEGNACFDVGNSNGRGITFNTMSAIASQTPFVVKDFNVFGSANGEPRGIYVNGVRPRMDIDGAWLSHVWEGVNCGGDTTIAYIRNCLIHSTTNDGIVLTDLPNYFITDTVHIEDNEIRNCIGNNGIKIGGYGMTMYLANNDIDNVEDSCLYLDGAYDAKTIYGIGNSYDNCNKISFRDYGAVVIHSSNGYYYFQQEKFGQTTPNEHNNIAITFPISGYTYGGRMQGVCNDCLFAAPSAPLTCGGMKTGIRPIGGEPCSWTSIAFAPEQWSFAFHNYNSVEDEHIGWGPGGMVFQRQTGTNYTTSNLKLQITPTSATIYGCLQVGGISVDGGDVLTVDAYLRKDEAIATSGRRPKIALVGGGFTRKTDYDEMSDVTNIWEKVTVTGTADYKGLVHIYVCAINTLAGGDEYTPTWPPTLDIYVDGLSVTK